jgi:thioredoxin reductase (NADPH)
MRIVNPTFGISAAADEKLAGQPLDWLNDPIALFSNSKPNARELMDGLKAKLSAVRSVDNIDFIYKPSASQPASAAVIDEVAHKYRAALLALGD